VTPKKSPPPPPENVRAAASRIFHGAPWKAGAPPGFYCSRRKRDGGAAEGSISSLSVRPSIRPSVAHRLLAGKQRGVAAWNLNQHSCERFSQQ